MPVNKQWYWDWRSNKAFYPVAEDDDTVTLVSVWHKDEVRSAIETGAFADIDDVGGDEKGFHYFDSFRFPDEDEIERRVTGDVEERVTDDE